MAMYTNYCSANPRSLRKHVVRDISDGRACFGPPRDCYGVAKAKKVISTPAEFIAALEQVTGGQKCGVVEYHVGESVFGRLTKYNKNTSPHGPQYLAGFGLPPLGPAISWFTGPDGLENILNYDCCGRSRPECFCNIGKSVGVTHFDFNASSEDYAYLANFGSANNETEAPKPGPSQPMNLTIPTFSNVVKLVPMTFSNVFAAMSKKYSRKFVTPRCEISASVADILSKNGDINGWHRLWKVPAYKKVFKVLGCKEAPRDGCSKVSVDTYVEYLLNQPSLDTICNSAALVRAYMDSFLDANPLFKGSGHTPPDRYSGWGAFEYITANMPSKDLTLSSMLFMLTDKQVEPLNKCSAWFDPS